MYTNRSVIICVGAATEVEALKNALTEACGSLLTGFEVSDAKEKVLV